MTMISIPFEQDGMVRQYILVLPPDWRDLVPLPLLIFLSGNNDSAIRGARVTGFHDTARILFQGSDPEAEERVIVAILYPEGAEVDGDPTWNNGVVNSALSAGSLHDVSLLGTLVSTVREELQAILDDWLEVADPEQGFVEAIDYSRMYMAGFSGGGFMVYRAAVEFLETGFQLAAVGVHSGAIGGWVHKIDGLDAGAIPKGDPSGQPSVSANHAPGPRHHNLAAVFAPRVIHVHFYGDTVNVPVPLDLTDTGTDSSQVSENADLGRWNYSMPYALSEWAELFGVAGNLFNNPSTWPNSPGANPAVQVQAGFVPGVASAVVVGMLIANGGHAWAQNPSATSEMLTFFELLA